MTGIETTAGIDKLATTKAMNSAMIPPEQRNDLRELLCGCIWTQKRQFDCQSAESPMESLLWRGTRGRGTHALEMPAVGEASPGENRPQTTVTARHGRRAPSRCGIFLEDSEAAAWADEGPSDYPHTTPLRQLA